MTVVAHPDQRSEHVRAEDVLLYPWPGNPGTAREQGRTQSRRHGLI